jgi:hypothetical protein
MTMRNKLFAFGVLIHTMGFLAALLIMDYGVGVGIIFALVSAAVIMVMGYWGERQVEEARYENKIY